MSAKCAAMLSRHVEHHRNSIYHFSRTLLFYTFGGLLDIYIYYIHYTYTVYTINIHYIYTLYISYYIYIYIYTSYIYHIIYILHIYIYIILYILHIYIILYVYSLCIIYIYFYPTGDDISSKRLATKVIRSISAMAKNMVAVSHRSRCTMVLGS